MIDYSRWMPRLAGAVMLTEPSVLAKRQRQVFWLIAAGKGPLEIAAIMEISPNTVRTYREQIADRIPALTSNAMYGALAVDILARS